MSFGIVYGASLFSFGIILLLNGFFCSHSPFWGWTVAQRNPTLWKQYK